MRQLIIPAALAFLLAGCGGVNALTPGSGSDEGSQLECFGDPDQGSVICKPRSELWDCATMPGGEWKCTKKTFELPDGSGGWTCTDDGTTVTCTKPGTGVTGSSGWSCTDDGQTTTCVYTLSDQPPGGGTWDCTVNEFGLECVGQPDEGGSTEGGSTGGSTEGGSTEGGSTEGGSTEGGSTEGGSTEGGSSSGDSFSCSYAMIVFVYGGQTYVMKIGQDLKCIGTGLTSKDANFNYTCNGDAYDNDNFEIRQDGALVTPYPGPPPCADLFTISSKNVTAAPGVTIIFGVVHNGSFPNHFGELCPPAGGASSLDFPPICSSN